MKPVKPAATIMLARDTEDGIEVLLLKRNKALKFAAGLWVFPGGKIEPDEIEVKETIANEEMAKMCNQSSRTSLLI